MSAFALTFIYLFLLTSLQHVLVHLGLLFPSVSLYYYFKKMLNYNGVDISAFLLTFQIDKKKLLVPGRKIGINHEDRMITLMDIRKEQLFEHRNTW